MVTKEYKYFRELYISTSHNPGQQPKYGGTYVDNKSGYKKRCETADNAARGYANVALSSMIVINRPVREHKIVNMNQNYSSKDVTWNINDPRGWEFEVKSENLEFLIPLVTIQNGTIMEPCFWLRRGLEQRFWLFPQTASFDEFEKIAYVDPMEL